MGDRNFKQIGKFQFAVEVPLDSDLMVAIKLATEKRDATIEDFVDFIKQGATREDKEKIFQKMESILLMNENIKVMEDAAIAVRMYKLNKDDKKPENNE